jgi:hypothetical protein
LGLDEFCAWFDQEPPARIHQGDRERVARGLGGAPAGRGFDQRADHGRAQAGVEAADNGLLAV